jgi:hypothetical protein
MPGHTGPVRQPSSRGPVRQPSSRAMAHRLWKIIRHSKKLRCTGNSKPLPGGKELDCFTTELHLKLCVIIEVYLHILSSIASTKVEKIACEYGIRTHYLTHQEHIYYHWDTS